MWNQIKEQWESMFIALIGNILPVLIFVGAMVGFTVYLILLPQ